MACSSMSYTPFAFYRLMFSMCEEQVNAKQAELLGSFLVEAMGGPAHADVGTGGGGSIDHSPWNDKDKRKGVKR